MTDKSFIKHLEKKILNEVSMFGFKYNEKGKFFYSFYNEIVFKLQLIADKHLFKGQDNLRGSFLKISNNNL